TLSGDGPAAAAAHEEAAREALVNLDARGAAREAASALSMSSPPARRRLRAFLAEALARAGDHAGARREAEAALSEPGADPPEGRLRSLVAAVYSREGRHAEALAEARGGLASAGASRDLAALLRAQVARAHLARGDLVEARLAAGEEPISPETLGEGRL